MLSKKRLQQLTEKYDEVLLVVYKNTRRDRQHPYKMRYLDKKGNCIYISARKNSFSSRQQMYDALIINDNLSCFCNIDDSLKKTIENMYYYDKESIFSKAFIGEVWTSDRLTMLWPEYKEYKHA